MKTFIKKIFLFFVPIVILSVAAELLLRNIPNDYRNKNNYLTQNSNSIETLFLGSSHAFYGINPAYMHSRSYNASFISQSLDYDYAILKKYNGHWNQLKYIVLPISYFSLSAKLDVGTEAWRVKNYTIYYGIHTSNNFTDYTEILSNKLKINLKRLYSYYIHHEESISCSDLGWGTKFNSKNKKDLFTTGKTSALRHNMYNEKIFSENLNTLNSIISFADKNKIKVLLFTPPAYPTYVENLESKQLNQTLDAAKKIDENHSNCTYVNLLTDTSFIEQDFYDADHLNEIGAEKLTNILENIMKKN